MADPRERSKQFGDTIRTVQDMMHQSPDEHIIGIVKEMIKDLSDERKDMEAIAANALDPTYEGGDIVFTEITEQLDSVEALRARFEVWSSGRLPVGSPVLSTTSSHRARAGQGFESGGGSEIRAPSPRPPFVPPAEFDDQPSRRVSDGSTRKKKSKKDKKLESGDDSGNGVWGQTDWGAPTQGSGAWGDTADWGTTAPPAPSGGFGDDGFANWGSTPPQLSSDSRNKGEHVASGWTSEASSHHKDRHGDSTRGLSMDSQHATLQIRRPYAEIERDIDGFKSRFRNSIAHAIGIPAHRIRIKEVQPGA